VQSSPKINQRRAFVRPYAKLIRYKRHFISLLAVTTLLKLWLAAAFPMTGDEAYFFQWGAHPDWGGFYDHPPMVGWWLWALQQISSHPLVLRLPAVLLWIAICFGLIDLIKRIKTDDNGQRWVFGSLFLALPFTWSLNFITTDTPLIFFVFFSGYAFVRAEISGKLAWDAACGVLLGLALLSKYFAGLLALTFAACLLLSHRGIIRIALIAGCALPFMALNFAWNSTHCWNNLLFNLINRHQGTHFSTAEAGIYLSMLIILVTPWTLFRLMRHKEWRGRWYAHLLYLLPLGFFLILSLWKPIGLHWILGFLPFVFLQIGLITDIDTLRRHKNLNLLLGVPILSLLLGLIYLPTTSFASSSYYSGIVVHRYGQSLAKRLVEDLSPNTVLMTRSYSQSSLLAYHSGSYLPVFGLGSFHARLDDDITDFSLLDGKNIRIFTNKQPNLADYQDFFKAVDIREQSFQGARFWMIDGIDFRFEPYRKNILGEIAKQYYAIPKWLPLQDCRFLRTYGLSK